MSDAACHFSLFRGPDLAVEFRDAQHALDYMAEHADALLGCGVALMVTDAEGMARVALVDARSAG